MKILTVLGARPQFVKAAVVSRAIASQGVIEEIIVHTGQHFDTNMSTVFFEQLDIPKPNYNLGIHGLSHGAMTGRMLEGIEEIILKEAPDVVLVYGDTNSTLAGALAARKLHIKLGHVEAGLRSFNMRMPEEINRILTDRISDYLFCPTEQAVNNLKLEGFEAFPTKIVKSGDVMFDAVKYYKQKVSGIEFEALEDIDLEEEFVLSTFHRQENTDDLNRLEGILSGLNRLNESIRVIVPLHPRTASIVKSKNLKTNFEVIEPVGYLEMISLISTCKMVITDSGGLQKESYYFKKPCLTLRDETEWKELVDEGVNLLIGADEKKLIQGFESLKSKSFDFEKKLYGDGTAAKQIVSELLLALSKDS